MSSREILSGGQHFSQVGFASGMNMINGHASTVVTVARQTFGTAASIASLVLPSSNAMFQSRTAPISSQTRRASRSL